MLHSCCPAWCAVTILTTFILSCLFQGMGWNWSLLVLWSQMGFLYQPQMIEQKLLQCHSVQNMDYPGIEPRLPQWEDSCLTYNMATYGLTSYSDWPSCHLETQQSQYTVHKYVNTSMYLISAFLCANSYASHFKTCPGDTALLSCSFCGQHKSAPWPQGDKLDAEY